MNRRIKNMIITFITSAATVTVTALAVNGCKKEESSEIAYISAVNAISPVMPEEDIELLYNRDFFFDRLGYEEQKVYINMLRACRDMKEETYFESVPEYTFLKAEYALFADHPEITWRWSYSGSSDETVNTVYFDITDEGLKERNRQAIQKADDILEQIDDDLSDYEKIRIFYDTIINNTDYRENEYDQDMTSVFIENESVCAGYSRAFQYLCKESGIDCAYIEGIAYGFQDDENDEAHAWNLVKLDDDYYWVDVTWGDPLADDDDYNKTYSFFCTDDEEFHETHKAWPSVWTRDSDGNLSKEPLYTFEVPECTDPSKDYYRQTGAFFDHYDRDEMESFISEKLTEDSDGVIEFKMGDSQSYESALGDLFLDRVYVYDIIEDTFGESRAQAYEVYYIQDEHTRIISMFLD